MMVHSTQGIYSPLPQTQSDSDSDKEINMKPICRGYSSKNSNNFKDMYRCNGHTIPREDELVKIKRGASKMSQTRKFAFVTSIILCFLPIFIFLWVLPCSELNTCPIHISNWEYQQEGIELKGLINLVSGIYKTNFNLAILYKGSFNSQRHLKNGILSFMGLTGDIAWDFEQEVEPLNMDCSIIDTNKDGKLDCLVVDSRGLKAIETISGQTLWHAHSSEEKKLVRNLDMPIAVPDLNNDGIMELLGVFEKFSFLIISGRTGKALANIPVAYCDQITELYKTAELSNFISYECVNASGSPQIYKVSLTEVEKTFVNPQYHMVIERITHGIQDTIFMTGNRKLTVSNSPDCPRCRCVLTFHDEKDQVLKSWTFNNAFIMNPKSFSFESSKAKKIKLRGHLNGFIVKIWQWSEHYRKLRPSQKINKLSLIHNSSNETLFSTDVTENVILITFNDTDFRVINASYTEINQICKKHAANCQPSVENQKDSVLVEDLEGDSSGELISYYSSYVKRDEDWHLVSYIKVLRLEDELPKLYDGTK